MRVFLILSMLILASLSLPASANYAINGQCFATATEALDSFNSTWPRYDTSNTTWWSVASSSIAAQNLTVALRKNTTNQASIVIPLVTCTAPTTAPFDIVQALAAFSFFFSLVILIFVVTTGGGAVLTAIKTGGVNRPH